MIVRVQTEDFDVAALLGELRAGGHDAGGEVLFVGTVREQSDDGHVAAIELEHYPGMCEQELTRIAEAAKQRFGVLDVAVVHRVGHLKAHENIVLTAAIARHRHEAFAACRYLIDFLKVQAPFWKREILEDGRERWVEACPGCIDAMKHWSESGIDHATHAPGRSAAPARSHSAIPLAQTTEKHRAEGGAPTSAPSSAFAPDLTGVRAAILTLSDSRGLKQDSAGDRLAALIEGWGGSIVARDLLPDDQPRIAAWLTAQRDSGHADLILTCGGTGCGPRDVTPEATAPVLSKQLPGVMNEIHRVGREETRFSLLGRGLAGIAYAPNGAPCLMLNLPGSRRGAATSLSAVADLIPHILHTARGGGH
ncbi:MAG: hypothetical protein COX57_12475 [Alphaproteobacteria bacterium CG_4_10_14_0_2_um_filter_63_37]|nr:MAG: hypothetical protein AUJ55_04535 [Proteobacteria bacterium CG1_02_64_396]PJA23680.1 MAG: hypothetical protein COX57_12475 [Alphaproteobacteria bacterium CG_4_10_14_0_2_um_filter_63_37]